MAAVWKTAYFPLFCSVTIASDSRVDGVVNYFRGLELYSTFTTQIVVWDDAIVFNRPVSVSWNVPCEQACRKRHFVAQIMVTLYEDSNSPAVSGLHLF
jgi:hypothetical protein